MEDENNKRIGCISHDNKYLNFHFKKCNAEIRLPFFELMYEVTSKSFQTFKRKYNGFWPIFCAI